MQIDIALEPEYSAAELAELGTLAENNGIATIWVTNDPQSRDLFMLYTRLAEETRRIRLGVMAVSPLEIHPLKLAASLLTLNEMSNGRASIVVGGGGAILAHTRLDLSRRVLAVKECIEILKDADAAHPLNFSGELYPVWNFQPQWAHDSPPRILAGANRDQMVRTSAHRADGIHLSDIPLPLVAHVVRTVERALQSHDRKLEGFEVNNFWAFHVKRDRAAAEVEARNRLILRGMLDPYWISTFLSESEVQEVTKNKRHFWAALRKPDGVIENVPDSLVDSLVRNLTITASTSELDDHLETLHEFASAGLTHITLGLHDDPADAIRLIGERIVPLFAAS
jgi:alkanesulfonate monooxygenase SsuD/methylene tetrahydromethanopterin reductase-like flavin-dependent oxidoreductase (luciferase family)